ncbi:hypothetical protein G7Y79_00046g082400 [Physcia stellaris]|nr:hypothetical protein G7Y79_00046g082400 [Physcia stellaris]
MSILTRGEIPSIEDLRSMPADDVKHLAKRHGESYRILRGAFLELLSARKALRRGQLPNTLRPDDWKLEEWVAKLDDDRLSTCSPMAKLVYMSLQSWTWFERWDELEAEVADMKAKLLAQIGPETEEEDMARKGAQAMIR